MCKPSASTARSRYRRHLRHRAPANNPKAEGESIGMHWEECVAIEDDKIVVGAPGARQFGSCLIQPCDDLLLLLGGHVPSF